jgi:hypothetical protein
MMLSNSTQYLLTRARKITPRILGRPYGDGSKSSVEATEWDEAQSCSGIFSPIFFNRFRHFLTGAPEPVRLFQT